MVEGEETKYYTLEEISKHDGKQDPRTWLIIKDIVYDVTDFLNEHPGGRDLIVECAGKDCTKDFEDVGHSSDAKKDLKKMKIGEVVEEDRKKKTKKVEQNNKVAKQKAPKIVESSDFVARRGCISIMSCGILA